MNIFEIQNYKIILREIFKEKRKYSKGLSRQLAEYLGVHPTLVSQVLTGQKDFTEEQILSVCEFLGLANFESKYILALLQWERAGSKKLKDHFAEVIEQTRKQSSRLTKRVHKDKVLRDVQKAIFYSSWLYSAVHLLTTLDQPLGFEEIVLHLGQPPKKIRAVVDFLIEIEMVQEVRGKLLAGVTTTHLDDTSPFLIKHHTNWRLKAIQAAENLSDTELMYTANASISKKDFRVIREELTQFIQKFVERAKNSPAEDIAQFNADLFWIRK